MAVSISSSRPRGDSGSATPPRRNYVKYKKKLFSLYRTPSVWISDGRRRSGLCEVLRRKAERRCSWTQRICKLVQPRR